jgi:hypothetical protein
MRFFRRGKSKIWICPTVAGSSPTTAELTAGTDISGSIAAIGGFGLTNSPITTPDLGTSFNSQIEGEDTVADSSFTVYDDDSEEGEALRELLAKGTEVCAVLMPYGKVATKRCEVWRIKSTGFNDTWSMDAAAAQAVVSVAVTQTPNQLGVIPTLT